jgi:RHS repeat-associated protein
VKGTVNGVTTVYLSNYLEMSGATLTKYYYAGSQRIAMRTGTSNPQWILGDHLSSTTTIADATGTWVGTQLYRAWGEDRLSQGSIPTKYRYTGQYDYQTEIGLYFYGARWYDASLGRWAQPDTIIPEAQQGVQAWDRFAYSNNNAVRYTDPTGHMVDDGCQTEGCDWNEYKEIQNRAQLAYFEKRTFYLQCEGKGGAGCPTWPSVVLGANGSGGPPGAFITGGIEVVINPYFAAIYHYSGQGGQGMPGGQVGGGASVAGTIGVVFNVRSPDDYTGDSMVYGGTAAYGEGVVGDYFKSTNSDVWGIEAGPAPGVQGSIWSAITNFQLMKVWYFR